MVLGISVNYSCRFNEYIHDFISLISSISIAKNSNEKISAIFQNSLPFSCSFIVEVSIALSDGITLILLRVLVLGLLEPISIA